MTSGKRNGCRDSNQRVNHKFLIALALAGLYVRAADIPPLVLPEGVGVNTHFTRGHEQDLDRIAAAGFKFIRTDFSWSGIERNPGEYDWSAYDQLTANLEQRKLRPMFILDYSNGLYEKEATSRDPVSGKERRGTASPQKPVSVAAFARWAAAAAKHFQGHRIIWEIWNEPNITFWKPKPDVQQYIALVQATTRAMRGAVPDATIVAPATSTFPWEFLEALFKAGALEDLDAVSVHPYRKYSQGPETVSADYARLRTLIEQYAPPAKKQMPILSGEWGYSSHAKGVSLDTQAAFIARQQLANLLNGVPVSIWYDWKNDGPDPKETEHNFGTVQPDLKPKPAYLAIQTLTRELAGCRIARRHHIGSGQDYVLVLVNEFGKTKLAAWTVGEPHTISLDVAKPGAVEIPVVNGNGETSKLRTQNGRFSLELAAAPKYVSLGSLALRE
jgi:polysaccharide biosynthesis protein PslG